MVQWVKDLALSPQQLGSLLQLGFDPWPGNFHMPRARPKRIKKKKKKNAGHERVAMEQLEWPRALH